MREIIDLYGITKDLLSGHDEYALGVTAPNSSLKDIRETIGKIVPVNCGHPLIRIGGTGDGAYLIPADLSDVEACFSPGVNNFKDFEDHLAQRYGIKAFMCDYSSDLHHLRTPLIKDMQFFEKKWLDIAPVVEYLCVLSTHDELPKDTASLHR